jgi:hypothetical protein
MAKTARGFEISEFQDRYDHKCSLQKSSLATEDCIWFGIDDACPQLMAVDALRLGIPTNGKTNGWVSYPMPSQVILSTRMHLTQEQVLQLLPALVHFAQTGDLPDSSEQTADIMTMLRNKE